MIYPILSNSYSSNCYLVVDEKTALVDAGIGLDVVGRIDEISGRLGKGIDFLINTHCHYDHTANDLIAKEKWNLKIAMHESEILSSETILSGLFNRKPDNIPVDIKLKENDVIDLGETKLKVIHTPGHTRGGICLYDEKTRSLFSGDTVFSDSIGRTDFSGGSFNDLKNSVEKLLRLNEEYGINALYPGHGMPGTGDDIEAVYMEWFS